MKKIMCLSLIMFSFASLTGCKKTEPRKDIKVGIITDYRDTTNESNIKTMFDLCFSWCKKNNVETIYRKPNYDRDENREISMKILLDSGCNVIMTLGSSFASSIDGVIDRYPHHLFIALDMSSHDMYNAHFDEFDFDYENDKWKDYSLPSNLFLLDYDIESTSYALGYTLAKEGYKYLNFVGNRNSIQVNRTGYSFIQGANDYSKQSGEKKYIRYSYTNYNGKDDAIISRFMTWNGIGEYFDKKVYLCDGAEVYKNAIEAATKKGVENVKIISTEYNYSNLLNDEEKNVYLGAITKDYEKYIPSYLDGILNEKNITSRVKMCPSDDFDSNYLDVRYSCDKWNFSITDQKEYEEMVKNALKGEIVFSKSLISIPLGDEEVSYQGNIKA